MMVLIYFSPFFSNIRLHTALIEEMTSRSELLMNLLSWGIFISSLISSFAFMVLIILPLAVLSMADGKTHERLTIKTLPLAIFLGGIAAYGGHDVALFALPIGHAIGIIIGPDLDLRTRTRAERHLQRIALLTWPLLVMSNLYAIVFGSRRWPFVHRGISHWPIIGTLTRWLWFGGPIALLLIVTGNETALASAWPALFWAFTGNCLSDLVHIIADAV
jgi:uncharacterized metal-binding protein